MKINSNISCLHRTVYVLLGVGIAFAGFHFVKMPLLICVLVLGAVVAGLGLIGFCPLCHVTKGGKP